MMRDNDWIGKNKLIMMAYVRALSRTSGDKVKKLKRTGFKVKKNIMPRTPNKKPYKRLTVKILFFV
jgi:ribosomal protein S30